jgi:hypothetical protein
MVLQLLQCVHHGLHHVHSRLPPCCGRTAPLLVIVLVRVLLLLLLLLLVLLLLVLLLLVLLLLLLLLVLSGSVSFFPMMLGSAEVFPLT